MLSVAILVPVRLAVQLICCSAESCSLDRTRSLHVRPDSLTMFIRSAVAPEWLQNHTRYKLSTSRTGEMQRKNSFFTFF